MTSSGSVKVIRAGWVVAFAFSGNRALACVTFAAHTCALAIAGAKHIILTNDSSGVVVVAPYTPTRNLVRASALLFLFLTPALAASVALMALPSLASAYLALIAAVLTIVMLVWILVGMAVARSGQGTGPIGPETPQGPRVVVSALAQMPGTHSDLIPSLRARIRALPAGTVVVSTAGTTELAERYRRLGLDRGHQQRLYMVL